MNTSLPAASRTAARTPVYLDNNATTACDEAVLDAMLPYFRDDFGNASNISNLHGWKAHAAVERARGQIAALIHAEPGDLVFTSGATESNNLAIRGVYHAGRHRANHIITSSIEHPSTLGALRELEKLGARVTYLPPLADGGFDLDALRAAIDEDTLLVCVMYANNEIGVINPVARIADIAHGHGATFLCDATQAVGKIDVDMNELPADLLTFSSHKMHGPKGIGALHVRGLGNGSAVDLVAQITGSSERGLRGGTLNVPAIVGFGKAAELAAEALRDGGLQDTRARRDRFERALAQLGPVTINGASQPRLPHVTSASFAHVDGKMLLKQLRSHLSVSTGSACSSANLAPSHVLTSIGLDDELAQATIRFSLSKYTTDGEIEFALDKIRHARGVASLRTHTIEEQIA